MKKIKVREVDLHQMKLSERFLTFSLMLIGANKVIWACYYPLRNEIRMPSGMGNLTKKLVLEHEMIHANTPWIHYFAIWYYPLFMVSFVLALILNNWFIVIGFIGAVYLVKEFHERFQARREAYIERVALKFNYVQALILWPVSMLCLILFDLFGFFEGFVEWMRWLEDKVT